MREVQLVCGGHHRARIAEVLGTSTEAVARVAVAASCTWLESPDALAQSGSSEDAVEQAKRHCSGGGQAHARSADEQQPEASSSQRGSGGDDAGAGLVHCDMRVSAERAIAQACARCRRAGQAAQAQTGAQQRR